MNLLPQALHVETVKSTVKVNQHFALFDFFFYYCRASALTYSNLFPSEVKCLTVDISPCLLSQWGQE